jgi:uncharacterized membrane protein
LELAGITGLWSALSFINVSIVLISIGLAYRHLLFGRRARSAPTAM